MAEECCCPEFNPEPWDKKRLAWSEKRFVKDSVFCLFYMPFGFGAAMKRMMTKLEAAKATFTDGGLCLSDHTSKWNMDVYLAVDKDVPGAEMRTLSGSFLSKVYEGPFSKTREWCEDFASYAKGEGVELGKQYMWYTTCPKCARKRGKNYVVILAEIRAGAAPAAK